MGRTRIEGKGAGRLAMGIMLLGLTGCTVMPEPYTPQDDEKRVSEDKKVLFAEQEPVTAPISLYQAMARAIKYNLDHRLKVMEEALTQRNLEVARKDLLPKLEAGGGYEGRDNYSGASSLSLLTGNESLEPSTSQEKNQFNSNLGITWNVLDFGVSYYRAKQEADRGLIAQERRRKVMHNIMQDVRGAYYRAISAQRLLARIEPLLSRVEQANRRARQIEQQKLLDPMEALTYQRTLLDTMRQLQVMRRELMLAKTQLAALMNLPPGTDFTLTPPPEEKEPPVLRTDLRELEEQALRQRPELREESYQSRISAAETRMEMLRLLPGLELDYSLEYDTNKYLYNNSWQSYGARVTWNLLNLFTAQDRMARAEAFEEVTRSRRLALNMAVMTQARVAWLSGQQSLQELQTSRQLHDIEERILKQLRATNQQDRTGELAMIQGELNAAIAQLREDSAQADWQTSLARLMVAAGMDNTPEAVSGHDLPTLARAIEETSRKNIETLISPALNTTKTPVLGKNVALSILQVGAFKTQSQALAMVDALKPQGYAAYLLGMDERMASYPYRVRIDFPKREDALTAQAALRAKGMDTLLMTRETP